MAYHFAAIKHGDSHQLVDADRQVLFKKIDGRVVKQLQDIALHEIDLEFCIMCLGKLRTLDHNTQTNQREAVWVSCLTKFFKCFGHSKARSKLSEKKVFGTSESADSFVFLRALRNKHVVHDENSFSNSYVAVAFNASEDEEPNPKVFTSSIHLDIIDSESERLQVLVEKALSWVTTKKVGLEEKLASEYGQWTRSDLLALPDLYINPIEKSDVSTIRISKRLNSKDS